MNKRIGIDVSAFREPVTGVGNYLYHLLLPLLSMHEEDHFFLYCSQNSPMVAKFRERKNVTIRLSSFGARCNAFWSQTTLAWLSFQDRLDFFWGANLSLPLCKRRAQKNLLTIYDFTYLLFPQTVVKGRRYYMSLFNSWMIRRAALLTSISYGTQKKLKRFYQRDSFVIEPPLKSSIRTYLVEEIKEYIAKEGLLYKGYALILGTIEPRKGVLPFVRAYAAIASKVLPLVLVGQRGWYRSEEYEELDRIIKEKGIKELGYLSDKEAALLVSGAAYLVMPSLYEGYGMGIKEALTMGTAVICHDVEEMREAGGNELSLLPQGYGAKELEELLMRIPTRGKKVYPSNRELAKQLSQRIKIKMVNNQVQE